jgi:Holliday junction resolvase
LPNRNYQRGAAFERRCIKALEAQGALFVVRVAGSKGPADLVAFYAPRWSTMRPSIELVQCKNGKRGMTRAERFALTEIARQTGCMPVEARPGENGRGVLFRVLEREEQAA